MGFGCVVIQDGGCSWALFLLRFDSDKANMMNYYIIADSIQALPNKAETWFWHFRTMRAGGVHVCVCVCMGEDAKPPLSLYLYLYIAYYIVCFTQEQSSTRWFSVLFHPFFPGAVAVVLFFFMRCHSWRSDIKIENLNVSSVRCAYVRIRIKHNQNSSIECNSVVRHSHKTNATRTWIICWKTVRFRAVHVCFLFFCVCGRANKQQS